MQVYMDIAVVLSEAHKGVMIKLLDCILNVS